VGAEENPALGGAEQARADARSRHVDLSAAAEIGDPAAPSGLDTSGTRHCVVDEAGEQTCFASFRTALGFATGGATADAIRTMSDESLAALIGAVDIDAERLSAEPALTTQASVVRAILYENADYKGNSWIIQGSKGCPAIPTQVLQFRAGDYWNDRISSLRLYSRCVLKLYENYKCSGATITFGASTNYVGGAMNDRASCVAID
jgi:hypothetical protein